MKVEYGVDGDFLCPYCSSKVEGITRHVETSTVFAMGSTKALPGPSRTDFQPCGCSAEPAQGQAFMEWVQEQLKPEPSTAELEAVKRSLVQMYREDTAAQKEKPKTLRETIRQAWLASQRFPTTSLGPK